MRLLGMILSAMLLLGCANNTPHNPMKAKRTNEPYWQRSTAEVNSSSTAAILNTNESLRARLEATSAELAIVTQSLKNLDVAKTQEIARLRRTQSALIGIIKSLQAKIAKLEAY